MERPWRQNLVLGIGPSSASLVLGLGRLGASGIASASAFQFSASSSAKPPSTGHHSTTHRPAHIYAWAGHRPHLGIHNKQGGNEIKFLNILCFLNLIQGGSLTRSALKILSVGDSKIPTRERESLI